jgi:transcriptional antiterminator RfaH
MTAHNKVKVIFDQACETDVKNWYVIYTKARHEKKVAEHLNLIGIEAYCPLKTQVKVWSDRKKKVELPLFNSYVFVHLQPHQTKSVFEVPGVVRYIYWCGSPAIVRDVELLEIKRWLTDFDHDALEVSYFETDQKVRILSGNFINQEARVVKQQGNHLVMVLEGLGIVLRTKVTETLLEKAG